MGSDWTGLGGHAHTRVDVALVSITGRPVVGKLSGSRIELKVLPVVIRSWQDWLAAHPETAVLSLDTGFERD